MNRFVAIDLGARRVQVVIQDADGVVLVNSNLEARLDPVLDLMRRHGALNARVAIEAGGQCQYAVSNQRWYRS